jgi:hypothetical protein
MEIFRRNVKPEIGDHLHSFEFNLLNEAFSKASACEAELQLRKLRMQRYESFKKPLQQNPRFQLKRIFLCDGPLSRRFLRINFK